MSISSHTSLSTHTTPPPPSHYLLFKKIKLRKPHRKQCYYIRRTKHPPPPVSLLPPPTRRHNPQFNIPPPSAPIRSPRPLSNCPSTGSLEGKRIISTITPIVIVVIEGCTRHHKFKSTRNLNPN